MPLFLRYKLSTQVPVEVEGVIPSAVRGRSLAEVERLPIFHGNQKLRLADAFSISGDTNDDRVQFEGNLSGVHWIGAKLDGGVIHVAGDAGRHLGSEMTAGEILVDGDASDWIGGEMRGGSIRVGGHAGHLVGAAYRGSPKGMTGGTILIDGDAGNEVGHSMRRGLIAIGGNVGDFVALNFIAGSVFVMGRCGIRPAAGMRRGTLAFLGDSPPPLLPTFRSGGVGRLTFLCLYLRELARLGFPVDDGLAEANYQMHHGDLLAGGRGEVLFRA